MITWCHNIGKIVLILLALAMMILLGIALIGCHVTGRSFDECFFGACCGSLYVLGLVLGYTYKEICVIVNIYLEAGLCVLSALWVTWTCINRYYSTKTWGRMLLMLAGIGYGLIYLIGFLWLCNHYAMPMNDAFDLCYREGLLPAYAYSKTLSQMGFEEISTKSYTPKKGDISVLPQNSKHVFGHIAIYNGEQWVSDFKQKNMLCSSAYRANGKYQIFRATDGWHWKHVWTSPVDWYRWAETVVIFCKNTWKAYLG